MPKRNADSDSNTDSNSDSEKETKKTKSSKHKKPRIEDIYKQKDPRQHILDCPGMYVGSVDPDEQEMRIFDDKHDKIIKKKITITPAFYKGSDEIFVNIIDQTVREQSCDKIKINVDQEKGKITAWNNGCKIPIQKHKEYKVYVPELIFGHLRTSTNYDKKGKTVGGKNGFGAKLTNIFSTKFTVELVDATSHQKYTQVFEDNMSVINEPKIEDVDEDVKSYIKVSYYPDFKKLSMKNGMSDDVVALLKKRVYDIAVCSMRNDVPEKKRKTVRVWFNDEEIKIESFKDYIQMHYDEKVSIVYDDDIPRWKVGVVVNTEGKYEHISYVNGICTYQGGTHVNYIMNQIAKKTIDHIKEVHKMTVKPDKIRDYFNIYIDSVIDDPDFNSQVKEKLTTKVDKFGSKYKIDNSFMNELYKTGYIDEIVNLENYKLSKSINKTDGKKTGSISGIPKLEDAEYAGTSRSHMCTLIITEGDSAKKYAVDGMNIVGYQKFGVWPIRGKFLNVGNATVAQLTKNAEFNAFKTIMGLCNGEIYKDVKKLRYGHVLILTDQDLDGSHIKGLIITMFRNFWPELLQIDGFIQTLSTPILKVFKKPWSRYQEALHTFYTIQEYTKWETELGKTACKKFIVKYYKGLGTSENCDAKEVFNEFEERVIDYIWKKNNSEKSENGSDDDSDNSDSESDSSDDSSESEEESIEEESDSEEENKPRAKKTKKNIVVRKVSKEMAESDAYNKLSMAFDGDRADDRKKWLRAYKPNDIIEYKKRKITFKEFIDKDYIHFANYDNTRAIPSVLDGFKTSQRQIMFGTFEKNIKTELKVAQLGAYIAERTMYKHGEISIFETIVNIAQNFTGSNNINYLFPAGNFGTRKGTPGKDGGLGTDHASERYTHTGEEDITRKIFKKDDDPILKYAEEEGVSVQPVTFAPIIPTILINGAIGIGVGFSTNIPPYNPMDIINNTINLVKGNELEKMMPYYFGFTGEVKKLKDSDRKKKKSKYIAYKMTGTYEIIDEDTVLITEIPAAGRRACISKYIEFLETKIVTKDNKKDADKDGKGKKKKKQTKQYLVGPIKNTGGNNTVKIKVKFFGNMLQKLNREGDDAIINALGLSTTIRTSNFHLYNGDGILSRYRNTDEIFEDFYKYRLKMYKKRREFLLEKLFNEMNIAKHKYKFIKEIVEEEIVIFKKKKDEVIKELKKRNYPMLHHDLEAIDPKEAKEILSDDEKMDKGIEEDDKKEEPESKNKKIILKSYAYLTDMNLLTLTYEKMKKLKNEYEERKVEYDYYNNITDKELWLKELKEFKKDYEKWFNERTKRAIEDDRTIYDKKGKKIGGKKNKKDKK